MSATGSNASRGFTLFEMLAVLVMLAVIAGLATMPLSHSLQRLEEAHTVNLVVAMLRRAHLQALQQGQTQTVSFDLKSHQFRLGAHRVQHWPSSLKVNLFTAREAGSAYRFFPDGASSGGRIVLDGGHRWAVDIAWLTGRVEMRRVR